MYSKQYCEVWDNDYDPDFDIEAIAKDMYRDRYYPVECKGLNVFCIHKDIDGVIWLSNREDDGYYRGRRPSDWERMSDVLKRERALLQMIREIVSEKSN